MIGLLMNLFDDSGFMFHYMFGKTLRENDYNSFMAKKSRNVVVYPVSNLRLYVSVSDLMGVECKGGYMFRSTNTEGVVTNNPFIGQQT